MSESPSSTPPATLSVGKVEKYVLGHPNCGDADTCGTIEYPMGSCEPAGYRELLAATAVGKTETEKVVQATDLDAPPRGRHVAQLEAGRVPTGAVKWSFQPPTRLFTQAAACPGSSEL